MRTNHLLAPLLAATVLLLAACAPAPLYKPAPHMTHALPATVAKAPARFQHAHVIWGGRIIQITNLDERTKVELLAYRLDSAQRPQPDDGARGRFIAVIPGYLEPLDYPPGRMMTISGNITGVYSGTVGKADYVYPLVDADQYHLWTAKELRSPWSSIHFGVGIGGIF